MDAQDVGEVGWNPAPRGSDTWDGTPSVDLGKTQKEDRLRLEQEVDSTASSSGPDRERSDVNKVDGSSLASPRTAPIPIPPSLSVQVPSPPPPFGSTYARCLLLWQELCGLSVSTVGSSVL